MKHPLDRSIFKALEPLGGLNNGFEWHESVARRLRSVASKVEVLAPIEPLAYIEVEEQRYINPMWIKAKLLCQRGYNVADSLRIYHNMNEYSPSVMSVPFDAYRLMTREQLKQDHGAFFGNLIADLCIEPHSQPILYALLTRDIDRLVYRPCVLVGMRTPVTALHHINHDQMPVTLHDPDTWKLLPMDKLLQMKSVPHEQANMMYHAATGDESVEFLVSIHPLDIDYATGETTQK